MTATSDLRTMVKAVRSIYRQVSILAALRPDRRFTPDGHMVGSIGEVYAEYLFGLTLHASSHPIHDAVTRDGRQVQIKATQGKSINLEVPSQQRPHQAVPDNLIVLHIASTGIPSVVYAGPGKRAAAIGQAISTRTYMMLSVSKLRRLYASLPASKRLVPVRAFPAKAAA
jgi:hypothetical protein